MSNEIKKVEQQALATTENSHILLEEPAFKQKYNKVYNVVMVAVVKCYLDLNWNQPKETDLKLWVSELTKNIQSHAAYKTLRLKEIPIAFAEGIRKEYGDYMGLGVVWFEMFLRGYLKSPYRTELGKSLPKLALEAPKQPSPEEKFKVYATNAIKAFNDYKQEKDISLLAAAVYRFLYRLKLVEYSEDELVVFIEKATINVRNQLLSKRGTSIDKTQRQLIDNILGNEMELEQKVKFEAQRLACYEYFKTLEFDDADLSQIIDQKKLEYFGGKDGK